MQPAGAQGSAREPAAGTGNRAIGAALTRFSAIDSRAAQIVEMRSFGGFELEEIPALLDSHPDLRTGVESLLRYHGMASDPLGQPVLEESSQRHIGPSRVLRQLGSGGMGLVLLAPRRPAAWPPSASNKLVPISMLRRTFLSLAPASLAAQPDPAYKPKRINKVIELLAEDQPVFYTESRGGGYEEGRKYARTWADYIDYELENGDFNLSALRAFMQGLIDGGPAPSGHRTPAVIATLPVGAFSEAVMRANYWVVQQVLATGVHGIILPHARTPEAVRAFVEATRYPFAKPVVPGLGEGMKGMGSQIYPSKIWGVTPEEYLHIADPWPLNPRGELILGLKIEDRHALQNAEFTTRVPGVAYAEWGSSDMSFSLGTPGVKDTPEMLAARNRVKAACHAAGIFFLEGSREDTVLAKIKEGIRLGGATEKAANIARLHTRRQMPW